MLGIRVGDDGEPHGGDCQHILLPAAWAKSSSPKRVSRVGGVTGSGSGPAGQLAPLSCPDGVLLSTKQLPATDAAVKPRVTRCVTPLERWRFSKFPPPRLQLSRVFKMGAHRPRNERESAPPRSVVSKRSGGCAPASWASLLCSCCIPTAASRSAPRSPRRGEVPKCLGCPKMNWSGWRGSNPRHSAWEPARVTRSCFALKQPESLKLRLYKALRRSCKAVHAIASACVRSRVVGREVVVAVVVGAAAQQAPEPHGPGVRATPPRDLPAACGSRSARWCADHEDRSSFPIRHPGKPARESVRVAA
jgi:hypothetical protein